MQIDELQQILAKFMARQDRIEDYISNLEGDIVLLAEVEVY